MNPMLRYALVIGAAVLAWGVSRNFDGPVVHIAVTLAVAFGVWSVTKGM